MMTAVSVALQTSNARAARALAAAVYSGFVASVPGGTVGAPPRVGCVAVDLVGYLRAGEPGGRQGAMDDDDEDRGPGGARLAGRTGRDSAAVSVEGTKGK